MTINVTMDDGPVAVNITGASYTDDAARAAVDGSSLSSLSLGELSVSSVLDAPSYPTQSDLPTDRPVGFIALIEGENRIYFEGA